MFTFIVAVVSSPSSLALVNDWPIGCDEILRIASSELLAVSVPRLVLPSSDKTADDDDDEVVVA